MQDVIDFNLLKEYDRALKDILEIWTKQKVYSLGDRVKYKGHLLECTTAGTSGTTTLNFTNLDIGDTITDGTVVWELVEEENGKGIDFYTVGESYEVGDIVIYSGNIYQCVTAHVATSTFDNTKWEEVSKGGIPYYNQDTSYEVDDQVIYDNKIYRCITAHTSTSIFDTTKWEEISASESGGGSGGVGLFALADNDTVNCGSLVRFSAAPIVDTFDELIWDFSSATLDNTQTKYEDNSLLCNSTSTCYCICNDLLTQLFTSGFTIDFWAYVTSAYSGGLVYIGVIGGSDQHQILDMYNVTDIYTQHVSRGSISYNVNEWQYWSLNFYNNKLYIFIDGKLELSCDCPYNSNSSSGIYINAGRTSGRYFNGYISDFKLTKNVKHTKIDFTSPSASPKSGVAYSFSTNGIYRDTIGDIVVMSKNDSNIFSDLNFIKLSD